MAEYMQMVGEQPAELSVDERNLPSVAYRNAVGRRRPAWRIVASVEHERETKGNEQQTAHVRECAVKLEANFQKFCDGILALMDENLVPSASAGESKVLYKIKSNVSRYLAESATSDAKSKTVEDAGVVYTGIIKVTEKDSVVTHPIHLAPAPSLSMLQYEVLRNLDDVSKIAHVVSE